MAIFPKTKRFDYGGQVNANRGGYYRPQPQTQFGGFGVDYIPTIPDVANTQAIDNYAKTIVESQAQKAAEIERLRPDLNASLEYINKSNASTGTKASMVNSIKDKYDAIDNLMRNNDPNAIFTQKGTDLIKDFGRTLLDPVSYSKASEFKRNLDINHEASLKNGTSNDYQVTNGMVVVENGDGKIMTVKPEYAYKYRPLTKAELAQRNDVDEKVDPEHIVTGTQYNFGQATQEISDYFKTATGSIKNDGYSKTTSSNKSALNAAKETAYESLSEQSKDAIKAEFLKRNNGRFSEKDFNSFIKNEIDSQAKQRLEEITIEKYDVNEAAKNANKQSLKDKDGFLTFDHNFSAGNLSVKVNATGLGRLIYGVENKSIIIAHDSDKPISDKVEFKSSFNPNSYVYGDGDLPTSTDGLWLNNAPHENKQLNGIPGRSVQKVRVSILPVITGKVLVKGPNNTWITKNLTDEDSIYASRIGKIASANSNDAEEFLNSDAKVLPMEDGKGYYIEGKDKKRYMVNLKSFNIYNVVNKDGSEYNTTGETIIEPQNVRESLESFERNWTGNVSDNKYFKGNKPTQIGQNLMLTINLLPDDDPDKIRMNEGLESMRRNEISPGEYNIILNELFLKQEDKIVQGSIPKTEIITTKSTGNNNVKTQ